MAGNRLRDGLISLQRLLQGLSWRAGLALALLLYLLYSADLPSSRDTSAAAGMTGLPLQTGYDERHSGFTGVDTFLSIEGRPYDVVYNIAVDKQSNGSSDAVPAPPLRDIIAVLLQRIDHGQACAFVRMVDSALAASSGAHVVLFHGSYPLRADIFAIRAAAARRRVDFVNVDGIFERPSSAGGVRTADPYLSDPAFVKRSKWAYSNMIRFWFYDIFCVPLVADGVRFVLRMDDDSFFPRPPADNLDLFSEMTRRGAVYISNDVQVDLPHVVQGLQNFTASYVREHALAFRSGRRLEELFPRGSCFMYFNNFEVSSVTFFRSAPVRAWSAAVLRSGGLYRHRWGDAPLRYITLVG